MRFALSMVVPIALAGTVSSAGAADLKTEREALFRVDKAWAQAAAAKDLEKTLAGWADDATLLPPGQPPVAGKEALRRYVTESFGIPGFAIHWETTDFVVSAAGDMAYGVGTNRVTFNGPKGEPVTENGRALTVWRKGSDGWKCVVDMWNAAPPAAPAADK